MVKCSFRDVHSELPDEHRQFIRFRRPLLEILRLKVQHVTMFPPHSYFKSNKLSVLYNLKIKSLNTCLSLRKLAVIHN